MLPCKKGHLLQRTSIACLCTNLYLLGQDASFHVRTLACYCYVSATVQVTLSILYYWTCTCGRTSSLFGMCSVHDVRRKAQAVMYTWQRHAVRVFASLHNAITQGLNTLPDLVMRSDKFTFQLASLGFLAFYTLPCQLWKRYCWQNSCLKH